MTRLARTLTAAGLVLAAGAGSVLAQPAPEETIEETKWGATAYGGGDVDSLSNLQFGLKGSYRVLELAGLARVSPELGVEFRKNFVLFKAGLRGDSPELLRFSLFGGVGGLHIRDFTNSGSNDTPSSDQTWFVDFGIKYRIPALGGTPLLGPILENVPLENVSLFLAEELTGLDQPDNVGTVESDVSEWYPYSVYFGFMLGSASGWSRSAEPEPPAPPPVDTPPASSTP